MLLSRFLCHKYVIASFDNVLSLSFLQYQTVFENLDEVSTDEDIDTQHDTNTGTHMNIEVIEHNHAPLLDTNTCHSWTPHTRYTFKLSCQCNITNTKHDININI